MQKIVSILVLLVAYLSSFSIPKKDTAKITFYPMPIQISPTNLINLHAGVYDNGNNTYTLRWATNDKTLSNSPRVIGLGSSTLAGYLLSYPDRLGDKIAAWLNINAANPVWINLAVGGYASKSIMPATDGGNAGKNIDSAIGSNPDFIFISLPTNDISNGLTNIQILNNFRKLDTMALNRGIPIFWETTQPRNTFTASQQTQLKVLADSIRAIWPQRYVEGFSNTVETTAGTDAQIKTSYNAGDGVHLNTTGNQQIADSLFARWKSYFKVIEGVKGYIIETSTDNITWSQLDAVTDPTLVKKTYTNTSKTVSYFRVKAQYTDLTFTAYSNTAILYAIDTTTVTVPVIIDTLRACEGTNITLTSKGTSASYQWQLNIGKGFTNIANATAKTYSLNNIQASSSGYHYRCKIADDTSQVYYIIVLNSPTPTVTITTTDSTGCSVQSFTFTAKTSNGADSLSCQWLVNNIAASKGNTFTTTQLTNQSKIQAIVTSYSSCGNKTAASNVIKVSLDNMVTPTITISGNVTVRQAGSTTTHVTATHTGTGPLYQWMDSTSLHTWRNITAGTDTILSYIPGKTGDRIRCKLTSNAGCVTTNIVYSEPLTFTVNIITAVDPDPVSEYGIRLYPNPVSTLLTLSPLKVSDKWETLEIRNMDGKQQFTTKGIKNQTSISVPVIQLESGTYILVLRRTDGKVATIRFLKL